MINETEGFGLELVTNGFTVHHVHDSHFVRDDLVVVSDMWSTVLTPTCTLNRAEVHSLVRGFIARAVEKHHLAITVEVEPSEMYMYLSSLRICGIKPTSVGCNAIYLVPKPLPAFMRGMLFGAARVQAVGIYTPLMPNAQASS